MVAATVFEHFAGAVVVAPAAVRTVVSEPRLGQVAGSLEVWLSLACNRVACNRAALLGPGCYLQKKVPYCGSCWIGVPGAKFIWAATLSCWLTPPS
jgi:hypothetical protein